MKRLTANELVAMFGGLLLAGALFANWYEAVSPLAESIGAANLELIQEES